MLKATFIVASLISSSFASSQFSFTECLKNTYFSTSSAKETKDICLGVEKMFNQENKIIRFNQEITEKEKQFDDFGYLLGQDFSGNSNRKFDIF